MQCQKGIFMKGIEYLRLKGKIRQKSDPCVKEFTYSIHE